MLLLIPLWSLLSLINAIFFPNIYPRMKLPAKKNKDVGSPLFITPYLKLNWIPLAQNLSRVSITDKLGVVSHTGFFTIEQQYNSNLFFWYFPPFSKKVSAPVILWLQGGPGASSLYGLFSELGPLKTHEEFFTIRQYHWALQYHLIFIDSPVGTGFSFTDHLNGYCSNEDCVATGLYRALQQFFELFPKLRKNEFYLTGESYAGKYVPSLGMLIHQKNEKGKSKKINLKGMAIGNGYCDPMNQLDYGNFLYQLGILDVNGLKAFIKHQINIYVSIKKEKWLQANLLLDGLLDGQMSHCSLFKYYTGYEYYYNFLQTRSHIKNSSRFLNILNEDDMRRSVHVGGREFQDGELVQLFLAMDLMKSVASVVSELLSHYRILFYNGQLDIIVAYPLTENFLRTLKFSSAEEYRTAPRSVWRVDNDVAGYIKRAGNLTEVMVRNAGHMVPKDQPKWALDLITKFINKEC